MIEFLPRPLRPYAAGVTIGLAIAGSAYALDRKIENHLADVRSAVPLMRQYAKWSSETLQALCRSNPDAKCPDVPNWPVEP